METATGRIDEKVYGLFGQLRKYIQRETSKREVYILEGVLRFIINVQYQYAFQCVRVNRSIKAIDWHGYLPIVLRYKLERSMIKEYGNVRKRTKKKYRQIAAHKGVS